MPEPILWNLGSHTPGKHLVLRGYLDAWLAILGMTQERILFIDGFAGPGEYTEHEPGSPIIALRALKDHSAKGRFKPQMIFLFVENHEGRVEHLKRLVDAERSMLPPNVEIHIECGKFDATMTTVLDSVEGTGGRLAPTFLMADPFGVSDTPMSVIARVLRHPKSEVYISFMYEAINRFKATPEFEPHLDGLFGCPDWRAGLTIEDPDEKRAFFFSLYRNQLKAAGATHVLHFELYEGGRLVYAIFFGSKHPRGCDKMKQAIWKVDPFGDYAFRGARGNQLGLEIGGPDLKRFAGELLTVFSASPDWLDIKELEAFSQSDGTDFHSGHLRKALAILEDDRVIEVDRASGKRKSSFPDGTRLRFKS